MSFSCRSHKEQRRSDSRKGTRNDRKRRKREASVPKRDTKAELQKQTHPSFEAEQSAELRNNASKAAQDPNNNTVKKEGVITPRPESEENATTTASEEAERFLAKFPVNTDPRSGLTLSDLDLSMDVDLDMELGANFGE